MVVKTPVDLDGAIRECDDKFDLIRFRHVRYVSFRVEILYSAVKSVEQLKKENRRESHEDVVLSSIETVMSLVLEESEEVNPDLISLLLDCMKKDNQPDGWSLNGEQAVAMRISGDKVAFYNCKFLGYKYTLCNYKGNHFFQNFYIEGTVDFIFGDERSLYLELYMKKEGNDHEGQLRNKEEWISIGAFWSIDKINHLPVKILSFSAKLTCVNAQCHLSPIEITCAT
ncbi:hypothetical protein Syun_026118 [Stephania yunnanensis]|uniref:Pectinesterase n=1 Tax=Stephania yunnanensis TaxID=152371 RepID=A0AAP0HRW7_9MAGN